MAVKKAKGGPAAQPGVLVDPSVIAYQLPTETVWRSGFPPYGQWDNVKWYHKPPVKGFWDAQAEKPWTAVWCGGFKVSEAGERLFHHFEGLACHCPPGPQFRQIYVKAREVACGGGRGSAKSEGTFAFLAKGDGDLPQSHPAFVSYLNCPDYKFLVLRKNSKDLKDYFERAKRFFERLGAATTESPTMGFRFPSGAWGIMDHVADNDAFEKYQGAEFTRIVWEEATQQPSEENYLKILMSLRSSNPDLTEQMLLTANPGGAGTKWFNARFIDLRHEDGRPLKRGEIYLDPASGQKRVFIFSTVEDNPYQMRKGYDRSLELLKKTQPTLYARWRHGDFSAVDGAFFEHFREEERPGEPAEACHVVQCTKERPEPVELLPWWPRAIGVDWGYSHASVALWGCWHPKGQLHAYRELAVSRVGTVELGSRIAKACIPDFEKMEDAHMVIHLSPDAFARTDDGMTEAEQIAKGVSSVLGRNAAFVYAPNQDEQTMPSEDAWASMQRRQRELASGTHLTIVRANNNRKAGWNLMREYLRWWQLVEAETEPDSGLARGILLNQGALAYKQYMDSFTVKAETLPKMLIWSCCEELIKGLKAATEKENDPEDVQKTDDVGDDAIDGGRYLLMGFPFSEVKAPKHVFVGDHLRKLQASTPGIETNSLVMAARMKEHQYDQMNAGAKGFNIPRRSGPTARRHRVN